MSSAVASIVKRDYHQWMTTKHVMIRQTYRKMNKVIPKVPLLSTGNIVKCC